MRSPHATERSRRGFLALTGIVATGALAGYLGSESSSQPEYEAGYVSDEIDGEERDTDEMTTTEGLAKQEVQPDLAPLDGLSIVAHEFAYENGYTGSTVQETAENTGGE